MSHQGTIRRYTLIIEKINRKQYPSFQDIQSYLDAIGFSVSKRTIERDIEAIRNEFGIEITYSRSKEGYYIDYEKSLNFESFLRFLEIVNTADLLQESLADGKESLRYISFDKGGGLKGIEHLKLLLQAIKEHRKISFRHFNFHTEKSKKYTMSPYLLKEYQNRWYVIGLVSGMNEIRTFGIERIEELDIKTDTFPPNPQDDLLEQLDKAIGVVYSISDIEKVVLSFIPSQGHYVKSLPFHHSQKVLIDNEIGFRIELDIVPNYELIQLILMHNNKVKVIQPDWLVDEVKNLLQSALSKY